MPEKIKRSFNPRCRKAFSENNLREDLSYLHPSVWSLWNSSSRKIIGTENRSCAAVRNSSIGCDDFEWRWSSNSRRGYYWMANNRNEHHRFPARRNDLETEANALELTILSVSFTHFNYPGLSWIEEKNLETLSMLLFTQWDNQTHINYLLLLLLLLLFAPEEKEKQQPKSSCKEKKKGEMSRNFRLFFFVCRVFLFWNK